MTVQILLGDCRDVLKTLPNNSIQCCVTSPPYYGLRSYLPADSAAKCCEIGLEPTPDAYVDELVAVFREVRRVLRDDGVLFLNIGDSYAGSGPSGASYQSKTTLDREGKSTDGSFADKKPIPPPGLKYKDLIMIPARVALALQADGWYLRSEITWCKKSAMPESVTDRPTNATEKVFLLTKYARYFYDAEAVKEEATSGPSGTVNKDQPRKMNSTPLYQSNRSGRTQEPVKQGAMGIPENGKRNLRNFWLLGPDPFSGWVKTVRRHHVEVDAVSGDTLCIVSPDCPVHAAMLLQETTEQCDVRVSDLWNRMFCSNNHLVQEPVSDFVPTDLTDDAGSSACSSGCFLQPCDLSAIDRNTRIRKMGHDLATSSACIAFSQTDDCTGDKSERCGLFDSVERTPASNTSADDSCVCPSVQTDSHNERMYSSLFPIDCTCKLYREVQEKISHFATMPRKLVEPCILAGTSEAGCCSECGKPLERVIEKDNPPNDGTTDSAYQTGMAANRLAMKRQAAREQGEEFVNQTRTIGFRPACTCNAPSQPCTVLDLFGGSGTTGEVAQRLGRHAILIELNPEYIPLIEGRTAQAGMAF